MSDIVFALTDCIVLVSVVRRMNEVILRWAR